MQIVLENCFFLHQIKEVLSNLKKYQSLIRIDKLNTKPIYQLIQFSHLEDKESLLKIKKNAKKIFIDLI